MTVYRNPMEKILHEHENATVVTNTRQRMRTFFRKIAYRIAVWKDRLVGSGRRPRQ